MKGNMNIDELTIREAKELAGLFGGKINHKSNPYCIGQNYFIEIFNFGERRNDQE